MKSRISRKAVETVEIDIPEQPLNILSRVTNTPPPTVSMAGVCLRTIPHPRRRRAPKGWRRHVRAMKARAA